MDKVFPKDKIVLTGNPVRANIIESKISKEDALKHFGLNSDRKTILIIGGSLGARTLNQSVEATLERINESGVQLLWQTGKFYYNDCKATGEQHRNIKVLEFIDRMDAAYKVADVIVSRAGALSIAELQIIGKPVILVPSPNVTEDHQTHNAVALVNKAAAILIKDSEAKFNLIPAAIDLMNNEAACQSLAEHMQKMSITNAAERIVEQIFSVIKKP